LGGPAADRLAAPSQGEASQDLEPQGHAGLTGR
jgi:hypothetical protein